MLPCQTPFLSDCPFAAMFEGSTSTAIQLTSASDVMSQHNEIGGIIFGADLVGVGDKTEIIHQYLVNNYAV